MQVNSKQFIFRYKGKLFAVPLDSVIEVTDSLGYSPLGNIGTGIQGILEYQGKTLPILDPLELTGLSSVTSSGDRKNTYLFLDWEGWQFAVFIESFYKIAAQWDPHASQDLDEPQDNSENSCILGIGLLDKEPLFFLSIGSIVQKFKKKLTNQIGSPKIQKDAILSINDSKGTHISKCICFFIGKLQFGIPIQDVIEVVDNHLVTPLFKVTPFLRGLINVRGKVIPCVDISNHLKLPYRNLNENTKFVVLQFDNSEIAICVDSVSNMRDISSQELEKKEGMFDGNLDNLASGLVHVQNETLLIVSSKAIIQARELIEYRKERESL